MTATAQKTKERAPRNPWLGFGFAALLFAALLFLLSQQTLWATFLRALFPEQRTVMFERATLFALTLQHLVIVGVSVAIILAIGLPLGVWLTRPSGRAFLRWPRTFYRSGRRFHRLRCSPWRCPFSALACNQPSSRSSLTDCCGHPQHDCRARGRPRHPERSRRAAWAWGRGRCCASSSCPWRPASLGGRSHQRRLHHRHGDGRADYRGGGLGRADYRRVGGAEFGAGLRRRVAGRAAALVVDFALSRLEVALTPRGLVEAEAA